MYMSGIQKVRRLTQFVTRYVHHILSFFNIVSCNWNVLGLMFLQNSDSIVEKLLILLFQPAICRADNVFAPSLKLPLHMGDLGPRPIHGSLGPPESTPQMVSQSVQPFLQGLRLWQTNRQTDRPHYSICNNRLHLHSEMQPNKKLCNIVVTGATNQWHIINEIYNVHLYQSMNFLNAPHMYIFSLCCCYYVPFSSSSYAAIFVYSDV